MNDIEQSTEYYPSHCSLRMKTKRLCISSGYKYEDDYGYSRAVRVGDAVFVSGTTARADALDGDASVQASDIVSIIGDALAACGATTDDVVRTVTYLRSMDDLSEISRVHRDTFGRARPASTVIEVSGLSPDAALVEIEVTAVISRDDGAA